MKKLYFLSFVNNNGTTDSPEAINSDSVLYCFSRNSKREIVFEDGSSRKCSNTLSEIAEGLGMISIGTAIKANGSATSIGEVIVNTDKVSSVFERSGNAIVVLNSESMANIEIETANTIQEIQLASLAQFGSNAVPVFESLSANGTTIATTSVMSYGVNSFTTATSSAYATKLPQPQTGRKSTIINNTSFALLVFPSNAGGTINNLGGSNPIVIPSDGVAYEFTCVENPNPGAWIVTPPATAQLDLGEITVPSIDGASDLISISIASQSNFGLVDSLNSSLNWAVDGTNKPPIFSSQLTGIGGLQTYYVNNQPFPINGITKVKIYTNMTSETGGGSSNIEALLVYAGRHTQYTVGSTSTSDIVNTYQGVVGQPMSGLFGGGDFSLSNSIAGTGPVFPSTTTNVGDAGTRWGEYFFGSAFLTNPSFSKIGTHYLGMLPLNNTGTGTLYDTYYTGVFYVALIFQNFGSNIITDFKARVFVEYN